MSHEPAAVLVKKKTDELCFCCDFRPLNNVTVNDALPLPKIDESLSRTGNAKIWCGPSGKFHSRSVTEGKQHLLANWDCLNRGTCLLAYAMHPPPSRDQVEKIREVFKSLREAGFRMGEDNCVFMGTETKYLAQVVAAEMNKEPALSSEQATSRSNQLSGTSTSRRYCFGSTE